MMSLAKCSASKHRRVEFAEALEFSHGTVPMLRPRGTGSRARSWGSYALHKSRRIWYWFQPLWGCETSWGWHTQVWIILRVISICQHLPLTFFWSDLKFLDLVLCCSGSNGMQTLSARRAIKCRKLRVELKRHTSLLEETHHLHFQASRHHAVSNALRFGVHRVQPDSFGVFFVFRFPLCRCPRHGGQALL